MRIYAEYKISDRETAVKSTHVASLTGLADSAAMA